MEEFLRETGLGKPYTLNGVPFTGIALTYYTCDWGSGEADGGYVGWHTTTASVEAAYRSECDERGYECGRCYVEADFVDGKKVAQRCS